MFTNPERGVYEENRELKIKNIELSADNEMMKHRIKAQQEIIDRLTEWLELFNGPMESVVIQRKLEKPVQLPFGREIYEFQMVEPYMRDERPSPNVTEIKRLKITYE